MPAVRPFFPFSCEPKLQAFDSGIFGQIRTQEMQAVWCGLGTENISIKSTYMLPWHTQPKAYILGIKFSRTEVLRYGNTCEVGKVTKFFTSSPFGVGP